MMEKLFIKNRKGLKMSVIVETPNPKQHLKEEGTPKSKIVTQKELAFVMHGLGGFKEQIHIHTFADAFRNEGCVVVRFDTTNTLGLGESEGKYEDATITNYYEDLEDVISWAKSQSWYKEPFWLCGHSLGGISTILFAEKYPAKVKGLAPISTVISGKISLDSPKYKGNDILEQWKKTGWRIEASKSQPGLVKKLKWSHMEDRLAYDVLPQVKKLRMPVLMIVGDKDDSTPVEHQKILFESLPGKKELHIIKEAPHTFVDSEQLLHIEKIFRTWIKKNK
ncbi:alpha/beta hydrolase [Candidatus Woesearchaeota archaeon]|nr:alpha/beta hydrolase [Candidatus Woesearchaeota archaeon]